MVQPLIVALGLQPGRLSLEAVNEHVHECRCRRSGLVYIHPLIIAGGGWQTLEDIGDLAIARAVEARRLVSQAEIGIGFQSGEMRVSSLHSMPFVAAALVRPGDNQPSLIIKPDGDEYSPFVESVVEFLKKEFEKSGINVLDKLPLNLAA